MLIPSLFFKCEPLLLFAEQAVTATTKNMNFFKKVLAFFLKRRYTIRVGCENRFAGLAQSVERRIRNA